MTKTKTDLIRPLNDRVLVRRAEAVDKTPGGIILPKNAQDKSKEGVVVAIGEGHIMQNGTTRPLIVKPGDRVLFTEYAGFEATNLGPEFLLMREGDILGIIQGK